MTLQLPQSALAKIEQRLAQAYHPRRVFRGLIAAGFSDRPYRLNPILLP